MSERMNKERARDLLKTLKEYYTKIMPNVIPLQREDEKGKNELIQALDIAIESLEQDQETKEKMWAKQLNECEECEVINNEWVDVRDRLPNESGIYDVLATIDFGNYRYVQIMTCEDNIFYFNNGGWSDDSNTDKVIAWKPLPHPYKRKE